MEELSRRSLLKKSLGVGVTGVVSASLLPPAGAGSTKDGASLSAKDLQVHIVSDGTPLNTHAYFDVPGKPPRSMYYIMAMVLQHHAQPGIVHAALEIFPLGGVLDPTALPANSAGLQIVTPESYAFDKERTEHDEVRLVTGETLRDWRVHRCIASFGDGLMRFEIFGPARVTYLKPWDQPSWNVLPSHRQIIAP